MSANKKLKTCIGKPKEECPSPTPHPRATTAAVKVNESLSLFLTVTAPDGVLRHINSFWIGFRDEDQYYRSLTPLECVGRWVLASLYAAKIERIAHCRLNGNNRIRLCFDNCNETPTSEHMPVCADFLDVRQRWPLWHLNSLYVNSCNNNTNGDNGEVTMAIKHDCFIRIAPQVHRGVDEPIVSEVCQGFVFDILGDNMTDTFRFSLEGIYNEKVKHLWRGKIRKEQSEREVEVTLQDLLEAEFRDDETGHQKLGELTSAILDNLIVTIVVMERERPWKLRLVVASGGYKCHFSSRQGRLHQAAFHERVLRPGQEFVGVLIAPILVIEDKKITEMAI